MRLFNRKSFFRGECQSLLKNKQHLSFLNLNYFPLFASSSAPAASRTSLSCSTSSSSCWWCSTPTCSRWAWCPCCCRDSGLCWWSRPSTWPSASASTAGWWCVQTPVEQFNQVQSSTFIPVISLLQNLRWLDSNAFVWTDGLQALFVFQRTCEWLSSISSLCCCTPSAAVHLQSSSLHSGRVVLLPVQADGRVHGRPAAVRGLAVAARGLCQSTTVSRGGSQRTWKQSQTVANMKRTALSLDGLRRRPFFGQTFGFFPLRAEVNFCKVRFLHSHTAGQSCLVGCL